MFHIGQENLMRHSEIRRRKRKKILRSQQRTEVSEIMKNLFLFYHCSLPTMNTHTMHHLCPSFSWGRGVGREGRPRLGVRGPPVSLQEGERLLLGLPEPKQTNHIYCFFPEDSANPCKLPQLRILEWLKAWRLQLGSLDLNASSITYSLVTLDKLTHISVSQFPPCTMETRVGLILYHCSED